MQAIGEGNLFRGAHLAKKIKLAELSSQEKARLRNTVLCTLSAVLVVCAVLVGCFACSIQNPTPPSGQQQTSEGQRLYWLGVLDGTSWMPQTNESNDGRLEGFRKALPAGVSFDAKTNVLTIRFGGSHPYFKTGTIVLESQDGTISFDDGTVWSVRFSEKNAERTMTIVDSKGTTVYFSCI